MRDFMKLIEGLTENAERKKAPDAPSASVDYRDAEQPAPIKMDSGASKGALSAASAHRNVAAPNRPGSIRSDAGGARMRAGLDGQSLNYLSSLVNDSGLEDHLSNAEATALSAGRREQLKIAQDGDRALGHDQNQLSLGYDGEESTDLVPTSENIEEVLGQAIANTAGENEGMVVFNPEWTMVSDLPGYMASQIRALGRMVFAPFTDTPIEDINVMAAPFTNTKRDLDMMAHWIRRYGVRDDEAEMKFEGIMPGYAAQTQIWNAEGYTFMLVMDHAGGYIYSWPGGRGVHIGQEEAPRQLREGRECGQCEGTGETDDMGHMEECPVCDGSGELDDDDDAIEEAAEPSTEAREDNLEAAKDVFDDSKENLEEGLSQFNDGEGSYYVQQSKNGHIIATHGPFKSQDEADAVQASMVDDDPLGGDGSPWAGMNEAAEPTRADDIAHILGQVHVHDPLSNPWGIAFTEGDETMAAMAKINEATKAPVVAPTGEMLTEAEKFSRLAGIGVKAKAVNAAPEALQFARDMAALAGIRR